MTRILTVALALLVLFSTEACGSPGFQGSSTPVYEASAPEEHTTVHTDPLTRESFWLDPCEDAPAHLTRAQGRGIVVDGVTYHCY